MHASGVQACCPVWGLAGSWRSHLTLTGVTQHLTSTPASSWDPSERGLSHATVLAGRKRQRRHTNASFSLCLNHVPRTDRRVHSKVTWERMWAQGGGNTGASNTINLFSVTQEGSEGAFSNHSCQRVCQIWLGEDKLL